MDLFFPKSPILIFTQLMSRSPFISLLLAFFTAILVMAQTSPTARRSLVVLHTNDTHSTILPLSSLLEDTVKANHGGFLRRIALLKEQRRQHPGLLLFDSGDFSQGSAYFTCFKGEVEIELMNRMHYDAVALGNHEFDFGVEELANQLQKASFPVVCGNYDFGTTPLAKWVRPYVVIERDGIRIGVFGLSPSPEGLIDSAKFQGITFLDPVASAREIICQLRQKEHCHVVVALSHLGWSEQDSISDQHVFSQLHGVDLVLGGHTHTYFDKLEYVMDSEQHPVPVDQNGKHAIYVGKMILELETSMEEAKANPLIKE